MAKRELSFLQKAYREFFLATLANYNVSSPANLTKEQKSEFFTSIKQQWKVKKRELSGGNEVKRPISKKEQYAKVKVSRPSIAIEPAATYKKVIKSTVVGNDTTKLHSEKNPNQTDNLKINFYPNQFFEQGEVYEYPVVKMPKEESFLKLPRKGRALGKGYKEQDFYEAICAKIHDMEIAMDLHMVIPFYNKPYEPDIVLIDKNINLYIDIEIDEPYDGYYRFPTHEEEKDDTRDLFFTESGWVVIRFTERQVHLQEQECIAFITDVINSIRSYKLEQLSTCASEPQWSYQQAVRWQKDNYRERYLGIEKFEKQNRSSEILVDIYDIDGIENQLERTKKFKSATLQENIAFEDESHKYHHPKDETGNAEYISVTTVIDRFFPFDMDRFIEVKAKREERTEEEVLDEFLKMRDEAAERGTFMHEQIENFLKGEKHDANSKEFRLFKKFYEEIVVEKGFEFVEAEKRILLDEFNVAGTVDALFKKPNKEEYLIADWKRSKKLVVDGYPKKYGYGYAMSDLSHIDNSSYYKYALQQNIYKHILQKKYNMPISSMNLIVLHENYEDYHRVSLVNMDKEVAIILNSINHKI
ncbi:hypothetical protein [Gelidibacter pelagius]|uniref:PD-(D/E)XK nuclease superfamily protein n=1 Tax=Gelidibacter pelagius TaxID=2819985 RepID=A0ABS3STL9_9FLAO|nr:hypothetical protein [Gelidibacter pelagius]MBO3098287.1 hypothetical protein [Gelidibacter pelagius]